MKTEYLNVLENFDGSIIRAVEMLSNGEIVAFPTETVYGLGVDFFNSIAIEKIYRLKGRAQDKPLAVYICSLKNVEDLAVQIPDEFYLLAEKFLPGPLTIILKSNTKIIARNLSSRTTIAFRMPDNAIALELINKFGSPIAATSANISGEESLTDAMQIYDKFNGKIAGVIDGGISKIGIESTVITLVGDKPEILRIGAISQSEIEQHLGSLCFLQTQHS